MYADEMRVDKMRLYVVSVDEMSVDEMYTDGQMSHGMPVDDMTVDDMSSDEMYVYEMSIRRICKQNDVQNYMRPQGANSHCATFKRAAQCILTNIKHSSIYTLLFDQFLARSIGLAGTVGAPTGASTASSD